MTTPAHRVDGSAELLREQAQAAEPGIAAIRVAILASGFVLFPIVLHNIPLARPTAAYSLLVVGLVYAIYVLVARPYRAGAVGPWRSYLTAVIDGVLLLVWLWVTGGVRSPFYVVIYLAVLSCALRFRARDVVVATAAYIGIYLGLALWYGQVAGNAGQIAVRVTYIALTGALGVVTSSQLRRRLLLEWEGRREAERLVEDATERAQGEREARERLRLLSEAGRVLSASLDYRGTLDALSSVVVPDLADWYGVELIGEDGQRDQVVVAHRDPERVELARELRRRYPPRPDAETGVAEVIRTGRAELYSEIDDEVLRASAEDDEHFALIEALGLRSVMIVPLARDRIIGAMILVAAESGRRYTPLDLAFAEELARRASVAVDNALLYRQAQEAIRARDDFLSIASHELRTPLTSLSLQVSLLQRQTAGPRAAATPIAPSAAERLGVIARQVERLASLVENLLDVSRVVAGRLSLQREEVDLREVVEEVVGRTRDDLARAGCELVPSTDGACVGLWDRLRLEQILHNLLTNAIKYGAGAPIEVRLRSVANRAVLEVEDHGIGIAAADQTRIFQRFERAVSTRHFGGFGLGLWIVRQIVDAMGGEIGVQSQTGRGALFRVSLPKHPPAEDRAA